MRQVVMIKTNQSYSGRHLSKGEVNNDKSCRFIQITFDYSTQFGCLVNEIANSFLSAANTYARTIQLSSHIITIIN